MGSYKYCILGTTRDGRAVSELVPEQFLRKRKGIQKTSLAVYVRTDDDAAWIPIHGATDSRATLFPMPPLNLTNMSQQDYRWLGKQILAAYKCMANVRGQESHMRTVEKVIKGTRFESIFRFQNGQKITQEEFMKILSDRIYHRLNMDMSIYLGDFVHKNWTTECLHEMTAVLYEQVKPLAQMA